MYICLGYFIKKNYLFTMESLQEISQYLNPNTRLDLKAAALEHILSEYLLLKNVLLFQF